MHVTKRTKFLRTPQSMLEKCKIINMKKSGYIWLTSGAIGPEFSLKEWYYNYREIDRERLKNR